jgi:hypothetical protein
MMAVMATKKGKKKVTKKTTAARKGKTARPVARAKKVAARRANAKRGAARKPAARRVAKPKATGKKSPKGLPTSGARAAAVRRRDRPGHIDPDYAEELREQSGTRDNEPLAFIERPRSQSDDLAEERAEEVIEKATSGEDDAEDMLDQVVPEEQGGPFVQTNAGQEFGYETDASNPKGAKREPFPTT